MNEKSIDFANNTLPNIKNKIHRKHEDFTLKFGNAPSVISIDYQSKLTKLKAKFTAILKIFKEENVISKYESMEMDGLEYFILEKTNMPKRIHIVISLDSIVVGDRSLYSIIGVSDFSRKIFNLHDGDGNLDDFDWESFSESLLQEIHSLIYNSKESLDYIL